MYSMLMQERSVGAVEGEYGTVGDVLLQKDARYKYCLFMMILLLTVIVSRNSLVCVLGCEGGHDSGSSERRMWTAAALLRYWVGVMPVCLRNAAENALCEEKPSAAAIFASG